jgi:hypothetical protein
MHRSVTHLPSVTHQVLCVLLSHKTEKIVRHPMYSRAVGLADVPVSGRSMADIIESVVKGV